jgi:hypothetical protein
VAGVSRLPARWSWPIFAVALALQWIDTAPLRHDAQRAFAGGGTPIALPALPSGARLLSVAPAPGCTASPVGMEKNSPLLLAGARAGLLLGDIGLGRQPKWFNCEKFLSNGLEAPLQQGEVRVFTDPQYWPLLRVGVFGNAACAESAETLVCGAGTGPIAGAARAVAGPDTVAVLDGQGDPQRYLGFGWKTDATGAIWSEGPRASLLLRAAGPGDRSLVLDLTGIAFAPGGARGLAVSVNGTERAVVELADMKATQVSVPIPAALLVGGIAWVALDVSRPVDPARRQLASPVSRAALRLRGIALTPSQ